MKPENRWLSAQVLRISFSAFFADLGYQAVVGLFPLYITDVLRQKPYVFGIVIGLVYGVGSLVSYVGGRLGDKYSKKRIALAGNLLIPLLSLSGLSSSTIVSSTFYTSGWFSRDFRSPPRRALLASTSDPSQRGRVFGFLHALDVGGGMISATLAAVFLFYGVSIKEVMLFTAIPILISSVFLASSHDAPPVRREVAQEKMKAQYTKGRGLFLASVSLFGFGYYSLGFPVITVARTTGNLALGIATFAVFLGSSGLSGYLFGRANLSPPTSLWKFGYLVAAAGSIFIAISYLFKGDVLAFYLSTAVLGVGTGVIETYEPVMASAYSIPQNISSGMGSIGALRSVGLFVSNTLMGLIFTISIFYAYVYAFISTLIAAILMLAVTYLLEKHGQTAP
ncbi:MAG: MFS transporter [Methanomassiliicoccales archaeon]